MTKLYTCCIALAACLVAGSARADVVCSTSPTSTTSILRPYGFTPGPSSSSVEWFVGNFMFYGSSVVGVCIQDYSLNTQTLYVIVDSYDNLLGWLPNTWNQLCLTGSHDTVYVLEQNESHCGVNMMPLNYNGRELRMLGQGGVDHLHGGNGTDTIYGGISSDNLSDTGSGSGAWPAFRGWLYGESSNDLLFGSTADNTSLYGGDGDDGLADWGGNADFLYGAAGNECCVYDANMANYDYLNCGSGAWDTVAQLSSRTLECEATHIYCNASLWSCSLF